MAALALTALIVLRWFVQGIGLVHWLAPGVRRDTLVGWLAAVWLGLVADTVLLPTLYFAIPGCTVGQLAWPVTLALAAASAALYLASPRPRIGLDAQGWAVLVVTAVATLLVLRPLLGHAQLGYYFSNNGEFLNYAVLADAVQFHDSATEFPGPFALVSREAVVGTIGAAIAALTGKAALWIIQPLAAAFAAVAFASLGLLLRLAARRYQLGRAASGVLALVFGWAVLSAAAQCFWTLSFVSQYLSIAVWFGGLVVLTGAGELSSRRRIAVLAALATALVYAYREMTVPNLGLLAVFEIAAAGATARDRGRAALGVLAGLAIALVVTNRYGYEVIAHAGANGATGWNIFGPHRPVPGFIASLTGLTSAFAGPTERHPAWAVLAAAVLGLGTAHSVIAARGEPHAGLRGLYWLGVAFVLGVAGLFWIVVQRGQANHYLALKFILGYGWLGYLGVGFAAARLIARRPRAAPVVAAVLVAIGVGLAGPAVRYSRLLGRAAHDALFLERDGDRVRELLGGARPYVAADLFPIVGRFLAFDRDVLAVDGRWPDGTGQQLAPDQPIVLVGDRKLADDPQVARPYRVRWRGHHVVVMEPTPPPPPTLPPGP